MYHKTWYVKYKIFISPNIADILDDFDYLGLHFFCSQSNHKLLRTQFMDKGKPNNVHDKVYKYVFYILFKPEFSDKKFQMVTN